MGWFLDELKENKTTLTWGNLVKDKPADTILVSVDRVNVFDPKWNE
ncbi:MAG: hypothetical protein KAH32_07850 [Chlamydiia bacterium]|nr:hypothetical protein [Chlamydiia bacterium]